MNSLFSSLHDVLDAFHAAAAVRALMVVLLTVGSLVVIRRVVSQALSPRLTPQHAMLSQRILTYLVATLGLTWALREMGFQLSVLLGAAGVVTVALGFASQTSVSNVISGLFLIGEQPFAVGDVITVEDVTGEVLSIDLLSVKLRTFDNLYVRIPNESMIKTRVTNLTRFPIRRYDVVLGIAYTEDISRVRKILQDVAAYNPLCLEEPQPLFVVLGFEESSIKLQFSVWAMRDQYLELRNTMYEGIKCAFEQHGVGVPFPHRIVHHHNKIVAPMPIQINRDVLRNDADDRADGDERSDGIEIGA